MKEINKNAPVKCSMVIPIIADSKKVWEVLTDINNWKNWQKNISKIKLNGELKPGSTFDWKAGGMNIHSILHTIEPFQYIGWTGKSFGTFAIHNWELTNLENETMVTVKESLEGFLPKIFKRILNKILEKGMKKSLDSLKQECEKQDKQIPFNKILISKQAFSNNF